MADRVLLASGFFFPPIPVWCVCIGGSLPKKYYINLEGAQKGERAVRHGVLRGRRTAKACEGNVYLVCYVYYIR